MFLHDLKPVVYISAYFYLLSLIRINISRIAAKTNDAPKYATPNNRIFPLSVNIPLKYNKIARITPAELSDNRTNLKRLELRLRTLCRSRIRLRLPLLLVLVAIRPRH